MADKIIGYQSYYDEAAAANAAAKAKAEQEATQKSLRDYFSSLSGLPLEDRAKAMGVTPKVSYKPVEVDAAKIIASMPKKTDAQLAAERAAIMSLPTSAASGTDVSSKLRIGLPVSTRPEDQMRRAYDARMMQLPGKDAGMASMNTAGQLYASGALDKERLQAQAFRQNLQELRSTAIQRGSMPSQEVLSQHEKNMAMLRSGAKTVGEKGAAASAIARGEDPSEAIQRYQESKRMWSGMSRDDKQRLREIMAQTGSREDIARISAGARTNVAEIGAGASKYRADVAAETQRQANEIKQQGVDNTAEYRRSLLEQNATLAKNKADLAIFLSGDQYARSAALMQQNQAFMREIADAKNAIERERIGVARDVAKANFADKASQFVLQLYGQESGNALKTFALQLKSKELGYKDLASKVGDTMAGIAQSIANDELLGSMLDVKLKQAQSFSIPVPSQQAAPQPQFQQPQAQPQAAAQGAAPALRKGEIVKSREDGKSYQSNGDGTFTDVTSGLKVRLVNGIVTAVQ